MSVIAGSADAAGFVGAGHVFTSNMTGNVVLLGIACGQRQLPDAVKTVYVLAMFTLGAAFGGRLARRFADDAWRELLARALSLEFIFLISFAIGWALVSERGRVVHFYGLIPPLALAMGLQSAVMNRLTIAGVTNTAMTGTLTNVAIGLENLMFGACVREPGIRERTGKQLLVIALYCGGALLEGLLVQRAPAAIGCLPAILVFLILIAP